MLSGVSRRQIATSSMSRLSHLSGSEGASELGPSAVPGRGHLFAGRSTVGCGCESVEASVREVDNRARREDEGVESMFIGASRDI